MNSIICNKCNKEAQSGLLEMKSPRGRTIEVCCDKCAPEVRKIIGLFSAQYGAVVSNGFTLCAPRNSPDVKTLEEMKSYL